MNADPAACLAFHVAARTRPDQTVRFVHWKRAEARVQQTADGFIKSLVLQPLAEPDAFYYLSFWEYPEALARLQQNPAFVALSAQFGAPGHPLLAGPVERHRCKILIDETGRQPGPETADPYVFHYFAHTGPDGAAAYETFKRREAVLQLDAPGFTKRLLLTRPDDRGAFYYISVWQTRAAAHAFHARFAESPDYQQTFPKLAHFRVSPTFTDCRLIQDVSRTTLRGVAR